MRKLNTNSWWNGCSKKTQQWWFDKLFARDSQIPKKSYTRGERFNKTLKTPWKARRVKSD